MDKLEQDEPTGDVLNAFADAAGKPDILRGQGNDYCKHYIDVARVFLQQATGGPYMLAAGTLPEGLRERVGARLGGSQFRVFPNPTSGALQMELPDGASYALRVFSTAGQEVWAQPLQGPSHSLSTEQWPEGMYILHFQPLNGGEAHQAKVVVRR